LVEYVNSLHVENYSRQYVRVLVRVWVNLVYELIPPPVLFSTLASLFTFLFLLFMPARPISMIAAFGSGLALALCCQFLIKTIFIQAQ